MTNPYEDNATYSDFCKRMEDINYSSLDVTVVHRANVISANTLAVCPAIRAYILCSEEDLYSDDLKNLAHVDFNSLAAVDAQYAAMAEQFDAEHPDYLMMFYHDGELFKIDRWPSVSTDAHFVAEVIFGTSKQMWGEEIYLP